LRDQRTFVWSRSRMCDLPSHFPRIRFSGTGQPKAVLNDCRHMRSEAKWPHRSHLPGNVWKQIPAISFAWPPVALG
jgi:hypothetical protein